jgi:hypothetical protein
MRKCQVLIPFQKGVLSLEELGGINPHFICFNPDRSMGKPDYKIQLTEKILLRFEGENRLISILDCSDEFMIIDSRGEVIADSLNTNPEFVDHLISDLIERGGRGIPRGDLN